MKRRTISFRSTTFGAFFAVMATFAAAHAQDSRKDATDATKAANARLLERLPFSDTFDFDNAKKGLVAPLPSEMIQGRAGNLIWDPTRYGFIKEGEKAPDTVNPSLWRQSQLINVSGLFRVADGIFQVRNLDLGGVQSRLRRRRKVRAGDGKRRAQSHGGPPGRERRRNGDPVA